MSTLADNKILTALFALIDKEFQGKSWNGPSFIATLDRLDAAEAAATTTWEGYSAWELGRHSAICKFIILDDLGIQVPEWPYGRAPYFAAPTDASPAAWEQDRRLYRLVHDRCLAGLKAQPESILTEAMPTWKAPWLDIISWLATHDAFHGAQIRSMGLPSIKEAKHSE